MSTTSNPTHALPYTEPTTRTLLSLSSFLLLLNLLPPLLTPLLPSANNYALLLQILLGLAYGTPASSPSTPPLLPTATQETLTQLGYIGLILLVYEGGLLTDFHALKAHLPLSACVALTGIAAPIGFSFLLIPLLASAGVTPLQAFAAGAALCSTSLGTTLAVLKGSGLAKSRVGVVLMSAAMLDDVVGLVMVQVISDLSAGGAAFDAVTVVRPIGVSVAFAVLVPSFCWLVVRPVRRRFGAVGVRWAWKEGREGQIAFLVHTMILMAFVVASSYAGTSNLFAAYLAGASISWYDGEFAGDASRPPNTELSAAIPDESQIQQKSVASTSPTPEKTEPSAGHAKKVSEKTDGADGITREPQLLPSPAASECGEPQDYDDTIRSPAAADDNQTQNIKPSPESPITTTPEPSSQPPIPPSPSPTPSTGLSTWTTYYAPCVSTILQPLFFASIGFSIPITQMFTGAVIWRGIIYAVVMALGKLLCGLWLVRFSVPSSASTETVDSGTVNSSDEAAGATSTTRGEAEISNRRGKRLPRPKSLYPASLLGFAMVARGEIGFLISALAESRGIFDPAAGADADFAGSEASSSSSSSSGELFLIVTWAIVLCTIIGPLAVGLLTKRVRRLQQERQRGGGAGGREDPLGVWGVA